MILRKVAIELTEKQYERLCQVAASSGKTVGKVVQTFAEELPENEVLQDWLGQKQERNFLAYLSEKGKLKLMTSLIERTVSYQADLSEVDLCQYFEHKKLKGYADFFNSSSSFCCGVI